VSKQSDRQATYAGDRSYYAAGGTVHARMLSSIGLHCRFDKQIRYESRKARADGRLRIKGRFAKSGEAS
jgi:hypothetical protein